ncbi:hypothetical protein BT67DRAFT_378745 [Trichocladium antarcticum]|uniref:Peroxin 20 n=1 Tax=Trichocladium antarcticum TaxID=1450529 RepID=A0AAN6UKM6_9PEZI|nr:hypothetical protein BT67DRAFT_378745 [Trichocladium antarcticum]
MADSMCGPSNGAKNLLAHVDRDRGVHQDRVTNVAQAGPGNAFRSQVANSDGAEMAFGGFQQGGAPIDAAFGPGLDLNAVGPVGPYTAVARAYGHSAAGMPAMMGNVGPSAPAARLASPATGGVSQEWVGQFSGMQLGPGAAGLSTMANQVHPAAMAAMNPAMNLQHHHAAGPFAMPMYAGPAAALSYGFQKPMDVVTQQPQVAVSQDSAIDVEAFNKAFGEYDDANFESELAEWTAQQKLANTEFAEAQDQWMAEHGPHTEAASIAQQPPTAAEMVVIDAELERLAQEQDKQRSNDELARAAVDIVASVADNTSDKFKNSRFFELMRRIGNREVVVEGDGFVNATTGEAVNTEHDDDHADSGFDSDPLAAPAKVAGGGGA